MDTEEKPLALRGKLITGEKKTGRAGTRARGLRLDTIRRPGQPPICSPSGDREDESTSYLLEVQEALKKALAPIFPERGGRCCPSCILNIFSEFSPSSQSSPPLSKARDWSMKWNSNCCISSDTILREEEKFLPIDITSVTKNKDLYEESSQSERGKSRMTQRNNEREPSLYTKPMEMNTKKGTTGQPIRLLSNYFKLPTVTNWCLYQYRIDFEPEEDRNAVKSQMLREHKDKLVGGYIFDGTVLFTPYIYEKEKLEFFSKRRSDDALVRITIRRVGMLRAGDYHYVHFFNLLMRRCLQNLNLQLVGRHYFDPHARQRIDPYRLELWPGFITSIRQHEQELLLCTEITHKVMRQETVLDLLEDCVKESPTDYKNLFRKTILGAIVLTDYNNRTYRVDDIDFNSTPASKFDRNGKSTSYVEYYREKYEIKIRNENQPMLITKPKQRMRMQGQDKNTFLVPELCRMTGLSDKMRTNFELMRKLADSTRFNPSQRMERLQSFNRKLHTNAQIQEELKSWQMCLSQNLVSIPSRILPREKIILRSDNYPITCDPGIKSDWTSELKSKPMLSSLPIDSWAVISPSSLKYEVRQFVSQLRKSAAQMEWRLSEPSYRELEDDRTQSYIEALTFATGNWNPRFILVILATNRLDRYSAVKRKCCVEYAVPTQVILRKNITSKNVASIASKVAIQLNCKTGGAPWTVEIPMKGLMVVGFDVYHDSLQRNLSIGALVASLDKPMSRYFSAVSYHKTGEELSNELSANICKALHKYRQYNNQLPQRIVIYRDGVGEGQLQYVYRHEVTFLKETLKKVYGDNPVKMAFIVVTKRINTRLFCDGRNPPPGTVVDDVITLPERYDFFLVSQSVRQGTVSPTSYNVIFDELGLDPDKLQRLTYKLTHLYFNWSGTVRVPAPVQYAHKLAFLVGQALHKIPSDGMEEVLYFL
ncbi:hypothetical protein L9F63_023148 [Diploptera punctata]|uniref:Piwi n=1 Tax=Diploptera punctata TaxID=6984 RepID=A0AAD7ZKB3_DIPPU|nr:hypothetical protein L9F63_023148 [Diploptera punctata]